MELRKTEDVREELFISENIISEPGNFQDLDFQGNLVNGMVLSDSALKGFCSRLGITRGLFMKSSPKLRMSMFQEFKPNSEIELVRQGSQIIHIVNRDTPFITAVDCFDTISKEIGTTQSSLYRDKDNEHICVDFVTEEGKEAKNRGDMIYKGITFERNMGGGGATYGIGPFTYRLVCTNGMIGRGGENYYITGNRDMIMNKLAVEASKIYAESNLVLEDMLKSQDVIIGDPAGLVHRLGKEYGLRSSIKDRVLDLVPSLGLNPTVYDIVNLITTMANTEDQFRTRRQYQRFGGYLTASINDRCPTCHLTLH